MVVGWEDFRCSPRFSSGTTSKPRVSVSADWTVASFALRFVPISISRARGWMLWVGGCPLATDWGRRSAPRTSHILKFSIKEKYLIYYNFSWLSVASTFRSGWTLFEIKSSNKPIRYHSHWGTNFKLFDTKMRCCPSEATSPNVRSDKTDSKLAFFKKPSEKALAVIGRWVCSSVNSFLKKSKLSVKFYLCRRSHSPRKWQDFRIIDRNLWVELASWNRLQLHGFHQKWRQCWRFPIFR